MENIEAKDSIKQVQIIQGFGGKDVKYFTGSGKHSEIRKVVESRGRITRRFLEIGQEKELQKLTNYVDGFSSSEKKK